MAMYSDGLAKMRESLAWFLEKGVGDTIVGSVKEPTSLATPKGIVARPTKPYVPTVEEDTNEDLQGDFDGQKILNWVAALSGKDTTTNASSDKDVKQEAVIIDETMVKKDDTPTNKMGLSVDVKDIEEPTALSGLSPSYLVGDRQTYRAPKKDSLVKKPIPGSIQTKTVPDDVHETTITFEEIEAQYSGVSSPSKDAVAVTAKELKDLVPKVIKSLIPKGRAVREVVPPVTKSLVPKGQTMVPSNIKGDTIDWNKGLKDMISLGEAKDYNTISRQAKSKPPKDITELTVGELQTWMKQETNNTASGLYQINLTNLEYLLKNRILDKEDTFDKNTQDRAYIQLLEKRSFSKFKTAMRTKDLEGNSKLNNKGQSKRVQAAMEMQLRLAKEWASIPIPYDLPNRKIVGKPPYETHHPNGLKAGMSYYESDTNAVPNKTKKLDFLSYLLSFNDKKE